MDLYFRIACIRAFAYKCVDIEGNAAVEHLERAQALDALARGLPAVGCHAEERLNIRGTVKVDRLLDMADRDVAEALIRRLLDLVGIGLLIEHLLHLPQVHRRGDDVEECPARAQHAPELVERERGEAVEQQVDRRVRHREVVRRGDGEFHALFRASPQGAG